MAVTVVCTPPCTAPEVIVIDASAIPAPGTTTLEPPGDTHEPSQEETDG